MNKIFMFDNFPSLHAYILKHESAGVIKRTFRRLESERQIAVINAILEEAAESGMAAVNVKEVSRRAGVSVGSLYQYFPNREAMVGFAVDLAVQMLCAEIESYRPFLAELSLDEALQGYLQGGFEWSQSRVVLLKLFARAAYQDDPDLSKRLVEPVSSGLQAMVRDILAAAEARGELRPDVDVEALTRLLYVLFIAVSDSQMIPHLNHYYQLTSEGVSFSRILGEFWGFVYKGIAKEKE